MRARKETHACQTPAFIWQRHHGAEVKGWSRVTQWINSGWIEIHIWKQNNKASRKYTLAGRFQWIEHQPANQRVTSSIPSERTCLGCGPGQVLRRGHARGTHTLMFLSFSFSLSFPLSKMNKYNIFLRKENNVGEILHEFGIEKRFLKRDRSTSHKVRTGYIVCGKLLLQKLLRTLRKRQRAGNQGWGPPDHGALCDYTATCPWSQPCKRLKD